MVLPPGCDEAVPAGTYVADHQTSRYCKLFPAGVPRRPEGNPHDPSPRRLKLTYTYARRRERDHFTKLPALEEVEQILSHAPSERKEVDEHKEVPKLPALQTAFQVKRDEILSRLYPNRRASTHLGEISVPVPTDEEFRDWLQLPRLGGGKMSNAPTPSQRSRQPSRRCPRRCSPNPSCRSPSASVFSPRPRAVADDELSEDECPVTSDAVPKPPTWVILLLRSTFEVPENSRQRVARCLAERLGLGAQEADRKARDAQVRLLAVVAQCTDRHDAFEKVQQLRSEGLVVQLTSDSGITDSSSSPRKKPAQDYGEVFDMLKEDRRKAGGRKPVRSHMLKRRRRISHWKEEGEQVEMPMAPADPVEAFFNAEKVRKLEAKRAAEATEGSTMVRRRQSKKAPVQYTNHYVIEALSPDQKMPNIRREACQMMRFFVFGEVGNEKMKSQEEKEQVFYDPIGSFDSVQTLFFVWKRLDADGSGRVDLQEFRAFAEKNLWEKMQGAQPSEAEPSAPAAEDAEVSRRRSMASINAPDWANINSPEDYPRFVSKLCHRLTSLLLSKKPSFAIEDMMRLIWPCAQLSHLSRMKDWCGEINSRMDRKRCRTPPVLPQHDFEALCSVFRYFDEDRSGSLQIQELVNHGLIHRDQAPAFFKMWDNNGDGSLDEKEFCEMLCPLGFRAHAQARMGSNKDGARVVYDAVANYWRLEESDTEHDFVF